MAVGKNAFIGFAIQSDYATAVDLSTKPAGAVFLKNFLSESLKYEQNFFYRTGRDGMTYNVAFGLRRAVGEVAVYMSAAKLEPFLKAIFGNHTLTEVVSGAVYKHEFLLTRGFEPYCLTIDVYRDIYFSSAAKVHRYVGMKAGGFTIEQGLEDFLRFTARFAGKTENTVDAYSLSDSDYAEVIPFSTDHLSTMTLNGTVIKITSFSIEAEYGLVDDRYTHNDKTPLKPVIGGPVEVTFRVEGILDGSDDEGFVYENVVKGTETVEVEIEYTGEAFYNDAGTDYYYTLNIHLPAVRFSAETPNVGEDLGYINFSLEGRALYDASSGYMMKVTLQNGENYS